DEFERQLRQYTQNDYLMTGETTVSPLHESELVQEDAALDLQLGTIIKWDEHTFKIESIEYVSGDVTMRDITFENKVGFPINRVEKIEVVRDKIIAQNKTAEESEQMPVQKSNYQITNDELGYGSKKEKYLNNITAIKTLQVIESEARFATPKEQEVLARYVGWGGLAEAFEGAVKISDFANNSTVRLSKEDEATPKSDLMKATANILNKDNWAKKCAELKELLSESEYRLACESVLNAHYTSPTVIRAMYDCIANMGFKSGNILEPSCGIGNFFGMLPESMKQSKLYGIELDSITGRIAKQLYQNADIAVQGFEQTNLPDSFFDIAIGNVPFGDYGVADTRYDKNKFSIHEYFFAKTLDKVRPGGIVALVVSRFTMDKKNSAVRKYLAERAELLGAVRLPNNAFQKNAGTGVTADILFLQKRDRPQAVEPDWIHTEKMDEGYSLNSYFVDHPEMILGTLSTESTQYGKQDVKCSPIPGADLGEQLKEAMAHIEGYVTNYDVEFLEQDETESIPADPTVRNYSYTLYDGNIYYRENSRMNKVDVSLTAENRIRGMIGLRDCMRHLIDLQMENADDSDVRYEQEKLSRLYDSYSRKYGLLNSRGNSMAFSDDSAYFLICSLEILDEEGKLKRKADMFTKRTIHPQEVITSADTASEALAISLGEKAKIDIAYMAQLTGKDEQELVRELRGVVFRDFGNINPEQLSWESFKLNSIPLVTADEYLSGNVRAKLKQVQSIYDVLKSHSTDADLLNVAETQVETLKQVQPKDLGVSEIDVRLGATWIPTEYIEQFTHELLKPSNYLKEKIRVRYSPSTATWNISNKGWDNRNVAVTNTYGTKRMIAYKIIEDTLNLKDVRVWDKKTDVNGNEIRVLNPQETMIAQQKQQTIKDEFERWIWQDMERRDTLCGIYNERFNAIRPREYDGSHLRLRGINPEIVLREHQKNAAARVIYGGNTLLAHVVGAG
ncbi:MAG: helicase, partial [Christensenella sp.]